MTNDGSQALTYDATGQQATASLNAITMGYDGDGLRLKKTENGVTAYYLRSTVLGQQTVCEINASGAWQRGYVYLGGQLLAIQDVTNSRVLWTHQEPYSKAQRITDSAGAFVSGVEVEPFGLETNRSFDWNGVNQKRKFTTYDRDANGGDEAMFRRYAPKQDRFAQPDPYDGSMSLANPQSLNRYAYVQGDPVNFVDPSGLLLFHLYTVCVPVIKHNIEGDAYLDGTFRCYGVYGSGDASGGGGDGKIHGNIPRCKTLFQERLFNPSTTAKQFCKKIGELVKRLVDSINARFNDPNFKSDDPGFPGHRDRINGERSALEECRKTFNNNCDDDDYPPGFDSKRVRETLQRRFPGTRGIRDAYRRGAFSPILAATAVALPFIRIGGAIRNLLLGRLLIPAW